VILQRPIERAQMQKLLATGKTDLLQFVSARTKRGFSAFLVRKPDGSIGFEFEAREPGKAGTRRSRGPAALRVLGPHPRDKKPVELHAGRYGPYVKHGDVNATLPDRDKADSVTLDEALVLLAEKEAKHGAPAAGSRARKTPATTSVKPRVGAAATPRSAGKDATAKRGAAPATARRRPTSTKPSAKRSARGR
jgi:topoisomerase IA-like protein